MNNQILFFECGRSRFDPDANAFILAAGITNTTQKTAINTLVISLKANNLWTKLKAVYPIVGGTASSHKFNLKNPLDTNAAFRLTFTNVTHSSSGITGTSGQVNTFLNASTDLSINSTHLSNYCVTNTTGGTGMVDMGASVNVGNTSFALYQRFTNIAVFESPTTSSNVRVQFANTDSRGFYIGSRTANNSAKIYRNGTSIVTNTTLLTSAMPNSAIGFLYFPGSGIPYYSDRTYAFFTIGDGLNDTEALNLYNAIQAFQTTLGRQV